MAANMNRNQQAAVTAGRVSDETPVVFMLR